MTKLSEIEAIENPSKRHEMMQQWGQDRGFNHIYPGLIVMRYIERLEAKLELAVNALECIARPALGGKHQQYAARYALNNLAQHEQEEAR